MVSFVDKMITYNNSFVGVIRLPSYYYRYYYYQPIYIYDLRCTGMENSIWDCYHDNLNQYCIYYQVAAVVCQCEYTMLYHTLAIYTNSLSRYQLYCGHIL